MSTRRASGIVFPSKPPLAPKSVRKRKIETTSVDIENDFTADEIVLSKMRKSGQNVAAKSSIKEEFDLSVESEEWLDPDEKEIKIKNPPALKIKESFDCFTCGLSFTSRRLYNRHMLKHKDMRRFESPLCQKKFKYKGDMKKHVRAQHSNNAPMFACELCEFTTKQENYLQIHFTRKHTKSYNYQCNTCTKCFKVEPDYKAHLRDHETGPQICDICGLAYPNKSSLCDHRYYKHTVRNKPFECTVCNKRLRTEKNLESHMQQHKQSYVCEECGMQFAKQNNLSKHRKIHGEKTYFCPVCGRAFACMKSQRVHMVIHSGIKPYICDVCGAGYTQRTSLMVHWRKSHPDAVQPPPPVTIKNIYDILMTTAD